MDQQQSTKVQGLTSPSDSSHESPAREHSPDTNRAVDDLLTGLEAMPGPSRTTPEEEAAADEAHNDESTFDYQSDGDVVMEEASSPAPSGKKKAPPRRRGMYLRARRLFTERRTRATRQAAPQQDEQAPPLPPRPAPARQQALRERHFVYDGPVDINGDPVKDEQGRMPRGYTFELPPIPSPMEDQRCYVSKSEAEDMYSNSLNSPDGRFDDNKWFEIYHVQGMSVAIQALQSEERKAIIMEIHVRTSDLAMDNESKRSKVVSNMLCTYGNMSAHGPEQGFPISQPWPEDELGVPTPICACHLQNFKTNVRRKKNEAADGYVPRGRKNN